ncbi:hypothetical protein KOW79_016490 [Hemibagrus wyckioides]|uniref:Uncharacterized protein n=1 Tax=Hemibagrus wyckioides TaxID=337641 RepID=A0A9D3NE72_9TELE|nr:hypothetical protein KOW79_016490 [Hemibagrus wyckioides]
MVFEQFNQNSSAPPPPSFFSAYFRKCSSLISAFRLSSGIPGAGRRPSSWERLRSLTENDFIPPDRFTWKARGVWSARIHTHSNTTQVFPGEGGMWCI